MRRIASLMTVLALAGGLAACGTKEDVVTEGETEGTYLDVGPLKYQVQISRQLNPTDKEDRTFLVGLPKSERDLGAEDVWFAVFVRAENESGTAQPAASEFKIETTADETFEPVRLANINTFAYRPVSIPAEGTLPHPGTVAGQAGINGQLLLFKVPRASLENRPLEFVITSPSGGESSVALDV